jgi:KaiC/GvpD/RAD55 family RecA-like ATPase
MVQCPDEVPAYFVMQPRACDTFKEQLVKFPTVQMRGELATVVFLVLDAPRDLHGRSLPHVVDGMISMGRLIALAAWRRLVVRDPPFKEVQGR